MLNIPAAPALEGATHLHSGKVRDLYVLGDIYGLVECLKAEPVDRASPTTLA